MPRPYPATLMLATLIWSAGGCARSATTPRPLRCETATQTAREARAQYRHERGGADDVVEFEVGPDRVTVIEAGTHTTYECTSRGLSLSATTTEGATWRFSPPLPVLPARNHRGELSGTAESDAGGRAEFVYTWDSAFSAAAGASSPATSIGASSTSARFSNDPSRTMVMGSAGSHVGTGP